MLRISPTSQFNVSQIFTRTVIATGSPRVIFAIVLELILAFLASSVLFSLLSINVFPANLNLATITQITSYHYFFDFSTQSFDFSQFQFANLPSNFNFFNFCCEHVCCEHQFNIFYSLLRSESDFSLVSQTGKLGICIYRCSVPPSQASGLICETGLLGTSPIPV